MTAQIFEQVKLESISEKGSYGIGLQIGQQLADSQMDISVFDKRLARCIGVDIRYVLYLMDKWGHADRLLKEINAK